MVYLHMCRLQMPELGYSILPRFFEEAATVFGGVQSTGN
ncbi:unnamed protein product [Strongylus vulgaris]|uniref:Uncharacterized protein n=1 Tax=Strongylus vulgaris TaxID=40348 RepID=A0A3P7J318_STRVU|nr:unnamed protein product [Strongylus vulgaris]